jgi:dTDP-4-dehydrorhamnose reductase
MRVLITGAGGQVGHELVAALAPHTVLAFEHAALDITDRDAVLACTSDAQPDAIVHSAAWTAVDACEGDPERAFAVNAVGTRHVAEAAEHVGAHLCYVSTDYVFDGTKPEPYTESDPTNPQSVYGRSKLAGEEEARAAERWTIARTSWVCGAIGQNMVKTILRLAQGEGALSFVDDQRGHPTLAADLAAMISRLVTEERTGLFHVTNQGAVSWYEFARAVLEAAGHDPARVQPIHTDELDPPRPAPRPANSVLDNDAMRRNGIPLLPDFRESLARLVEQLETAKR